MQDDEETIVNRIVQSQASLYRFILSLVGNYNDAEDLMQQTMVTVWKKQTQATTVDLLPWMFAIAKNHVRNHIRKRNRRGDVNGLNNDCLERIAEAQQKRLGQANVRQQALSDCLEQLTDEKRNLIDDYYERELTVPQLAEKFCKNVEAIYKSLRRIRKALFDCVSRKLPDGESA